MQEAIKIAGWMAYRVLLSSTGKDLATCRDAAEEAIRRLDGFTVDRMENWGARDNCAEIFDDQRVQAADLVVFIIGHCYGSSPPGTVTSYTELEYGAAYAGRLFFIANEELPLPRRLRETDELQALQDTFRQRILGEDPPPIVEFFGGSEDFGMLVGTSVSNWRPRSSQESGGGSVRIHRGLFNVPRRPDLIGREGMVERIHVMLRNAEKTAIVPALSGQGGIGKTQLAALYANDHRDDYPGGIFWLNMATPTAESLLPQFGYYGREVTKRRFESDEHAAEAFLGAIANEDKALVVLDNLEREALLTGPLPGLPAHRLDTLHCRMLVTTRKGELAGCKSLSVELLAPGDASALLEREAGRAADGDDVAFRNVLDRLGGLPLAIRIGGNLVRRLGWAYADLDRQLSEHGIEGLDWEKARPEDYQNTLNALLDEQWRALPEEHRDALHDILRTLGLLPESAPIRLSFLKEIGVPGLADLPGWLDPFEQAIGELAQHNLVEQPDGETVRLHPLVHDFAKHWADDAFEQRLFERADGKLANVTWLAGLSAEQLLRLCRECRPLVNRGAALGKFMRTLQRALDAQSHA